MPPAVAARPYRVQVQVLARVGGTWVNSAGLSPDGRSLVWCDGPFGGHDPANVRISETSGGAPRVLARDAHTPVWSPHGKRVAFLRPNRGLELWTVRPDGSDPGLRARGLGTHWRRQFAWSPRGHRIAYVTRDGVERRHSLWVMDPDGEHKRRLLSAGTGLEFVWSPDSRRLCAWQSGEGTYDDSGNLRPLRSWVADVDSSRVPQVKPPRRGGFTGTPALSPASRYLALTCFGPEKDWHEETQRHHPRVSLLVKAFPSGAWRRITSYPGANGEVCWSPAGDRLALERTGVSDCGCYTPRQLSLWTLGGRFLRRFLEASQPVWSPDGQQLRFALRTGEGEYSTVVCDRDGGYETHLPAGSCGMQWTRDGALVTSSRVGPVKLTTVELLRFLP